MMHAQSMTGYGRGSAGSFKVEVRSTNHKNLDIHFNVPYYLFSHESEMKKIVKRKFQRGRLEIFIPRLELENVSLKVNKSLAREYYNSLVSLRDDLSLSDKVSIEMVASQKDIFLLDEPEIDIHGLYEALETALDELWKNRVEEGSNLIRDIAGRIDAIEQYLLDIERCRAEFTASARGKLRDRIKDFLGDIEVDETRLIQEAAIIVEKTDITEEIVRIKSHLKHFKEVYESGDTIGKKLDFIIQELRREINTIGSKAQNYRIASDVVEFKHELEKIREQVQNLQ